MPFPASPQISETMSRKFVGCSPLLGAKPRWSQVVDIRFVIKRVSQMCCIDLTEDLVEVYKKRETIVAADIGGFTSKIKTSEVVPSRCSRGIQLVCASFLTKNELSKRQMLEQAREVFEEGLKSLPEHAGVLALCGDCCLMLSHHFLFFKARQVLEKAEDYYRKALSVRPQWKEVMHRLGDVHCEQAKFTRVPDTARRLRVRGGTRYLQALCFEWELNYAIKKQKTHKLDHLLQLPKGDIAAISLATKAFTEFEEIDLSGAPEISASGIRRSLGKKSVLKKFNANSCSNFKNSVLTYVCSRAHRTLTSLNMGNCMAIGTDGMVGLARNCEKLRKLVLDGSVGIEDDGLTEAFKCLTALTHLSMRGLPRVTNKSGVFIGKYIHQLEYLDMSDTTQVVPSPEVATARCSLCLLVWHKTFRASSPRANGSQRHPSRIEWWRPLACHCRENLVLVLLDPLVVRTVCPFLSPGHGDNHQRSRTAVHQFQDCQGRRLLHCR